MDGEREREGEGEGEGERERGGGGGGGEKNVTQRNRSKITYSPSRNSRGAGKLFPRNKSKFGQKLEKSYNRLKYLEKNEHFGNNRLPTIASGRVTQILTIFHYDCHGFFGIKKINDRQY